MSPEEQKELDRHKKAITKILKETRVGKAYPIGYAPVLSVFYSEGTSVGGSVGVSLPLGTAFALAIASPPGDIKPPLHELPLL